jgi:hypothetical protein
VIGPGLGPRPLDAGVPVVGAPVRARHPWYRLFVLAYDRLYRACHRLDRPAARVGPALRIQLSRAGRARTLGDGTRIRRGDRIAAIHLDNAGIAGIHANGMAPLSMGLEFRRQFLDSLHGLATLAAPGGPLADVRAVVATTIFHRGLARLGFQPEDGGWLWPRLVATYQRALVASLHPAGAFRLREATYRTARRLWMSREALVQRFGQAAVEVPADGGVRVTRVAWRPRGAAAVREDQT